MNWQKTQRLVHFVEGTSQDFRKKSASVARKCGFTEVDIITDLNKYTGKEEQFGISVLTKADWERVQK